MANNDQVLLDQILEEQRVSRAPTATKSDFFEQYVAEQVLKDYDLSDDEVEYGLTGGGHDGGIDAIYTFANGELVQEDFDHTTLKKSVVIDVVIIQSKTSNGFDEATINKLMAVTGHLFALANPLSDYTAVYNEGVLEGVGNFRRLYTAIAGRFPTLRFMYFYVSRGESNSVHPNVHRKTDDLRQVVLGLFPHAKYEFSFYGASDLLGLARRQPSSSFELKFLESLTGRDGYIALVRLKDFINFIRTDNGQLRKNLFEANVRDYQGSNQVNEDMQQTLLSGGPEDFWWLNNGVTVVASRAVQGGKILTIEDPQIVNGQQTSTEIFNYFHGANTDADERCVMVRVIVANEPASRDRIIKATNSQTSIPAASLRATEKIHRDIQEFLVPFSIYYDRRKNSQKQLGRPIDKIIGIALMAQAMMSIVLQRPDDARARPSSLIKKDEDYNRIFSPKLPIQIYLIAATIVKTAQSSLRGREDLAPKDRNNLLFYVAMHASAALACASAPSSEQLAAIAPESITDAIMNASISTVETIYRQLGANDQTAKGTQFLAALKEKLSEQFP
ncbi:abortive phage resistance protein [Burkholderia ubonensis]|uniref:AIPR family protein n=1 Tax=Burkholderia ubonensis TaxID=101571 RepID=UPI00075EFBF9|nr:AIPR family protein [Burkholderia ubonensis]KVM04128.1 abortive phage resistance protein [Burkholderia ubonensis]KVM17113.1 abortive phage resistance protein [Burkholderia ubonensis]KVM56927.1 abortive phage resistance protein [Burkholderia ubonensis]KVM65967.1 abortive phage resistance protein [Burkholderia ubonensis]KVU47974.1 abortive phage resistance protein [Burkholderia ubonensis]